MRSWRDWSWADGNFWDSGVQPQFSRYRPGLLRWDPAVANLRVTGSFQLADTDRVLTLLAATLPVELQWRTRFWVTLIPRSVAV